MEYPGTDSPWTQVLTSVGGRLVSPAVLSPPVTLASGETLEPITTFFVPLDQWKGAAFQHDFGKKSAAMVDVDAEHLFAELAIVRILAKEGWDGRWVSTYGAGNTANFWTRWQDIGRSQPSEALPAEQARLFEALRVRNGGSPNGAWDVFAWKDGTYLFGECKRKNKDAVRGTQRRWLESALNLGHEGVSAESFAFITWDYR